jgi:hypothetical protein
MRMGGMASPSFHTLGIYTQLLHTVYCGAVVSLYPPTVFSPKDLPIAPTSDNILEHLQRNGCMGLVIIPSIVQMWSHSQEAIDYLKTLVIVVSPSLFEHESAFNDGFRVTQVGRWPKSWETHWPQLA